MKIVSNTGGIAVTNSFLIADEQAKQAVIFDAPNDTVAPLLDEAQKQGWDVVGLWLTHGHFDHVADHKLVTDRFPGAKVLIHRLDEPKLIEPGSKFFPIPFVIPPRKADAYVEDGQVLALGNLRAKVIHTPGHAPGHVMYYFEDEGVLVGGDLIIGGSVGRTDLPDSRHTDLEASIRKVMRLPGDTTLLPGHGHPSTLREELELNPYVQAAVEAER
jgi:glyoxylase-like metal-dependent hydrolase (beta-lactamase superfamily II)